MPPLIILNSFYYNDQTREYNPQEVYINPMKIEYVKQLPRRPNDCNPNNTSPVSLVVLGNGSFIVRETPDEIYSIMEAHG